MRLLRGPISPSRDADVPTPRVAGPGLRPLALAAWAATLLAPAPLAAWPGDGGAPNLWLYVAIALGVMAIGLVAWFIWVRAEVRSLEGPAFLVLRRDRAERLAIVGAQAEMEDGVGARLNASGQAPVRQVVSPFARAAETEAAGVAPLAGASEVVMFAAGAGQAALPADATLQFLPGRLQFVGEQVGPDIRFIRQPGPATVVTLGRGHGPADRHVHLPGGTVSRLHARLRYAGGRWTVSNLSRTNPLRVNGRALEPGVETSVLAEGDRLELGELAFIFREK